MVSVSNGAQTPYGSVWQLPVGPRRLADTRLTLSSPPEPRRPQFCSLPPGTLGLLSPEGRRVGDCKTMLGKPQAWSKLNRYT
jgi:hypothetical protein